MDNALTTATYNNIIDQESTKGTGKNRTFEELGSLLHKGDRTELQKIIVLHFKVFRLKDSNQPINAASAPTGKKVLFRLVSQVLHSKPNMNHNLYDDGPLMQMILNVFQNYDLDSRSVPVSKKKYDSFCDKITKTAYIDYQEQRLTRNLYTAYNRIACIGYIFVSAFYKLKLTLFFNVSELGAIQNR